MPTYRMTVTLTEELVIEAATKEEAESKAMAIAFQDPDLSNADWGRTSKDED